MGGGEEGNIGVYTCVPNGEFRRQAGSLESIILDGAKWILG